MTDTIIIILHAIYSWQAPDKYTACPSCPDVIVFAIDSGYVYGELQEPW